VMSPNSSKKVMNGLGEEEKRKEASMAELTPHSSAFPVQFPRSARRIVGKRLLSHRGKAESEKEKERRRKCQIISIAIIFVCCVLHFAELDGGKEERKEVSGG